MDWEAIYQTRVLPVLGVKRGGVPSPRLIFVCGQPGSGKSTTINRLLDELGPDQTQLINVDTLADQLPEVFADWAEPADAALADTFKTEVGKAYVDALFAHASALEAHVIWERPFPSRAVSLGLAARAIGYRVECVVLAVPAEEGWLSVLKRETARANEAGRVPLRVPWPRLEESYCRWPAFLASAEDSHGFDTIRVVGRDGQSLYENHLVTGSGAPQWEGPVFAFESLMVERLQPRSREQMDGMIADWQSLRAHPDLAFCNQPAWPWADIMALGDRLLALREDPATGFDLNNLAHSTPEAAKGWLARLRADLARVQASPEAEGLATLAPRSERLLALVQSLTR